MSRWIEGGMRALLPILLAFTLGFILFAVTGYDVGEVIDGMWQGAVAAPGSLEQSLRWAIPLAVVSLGIIITLRTGEFNIGAQGQILIGGLGAVILPLLAPEWPVPIVIPLAIVMGMIGGAFWSGIAGVLKVWFNSDEVINTLMLNFIAVLLIQWVTTGPLKDEATRGETASTPRIDGMFRLSDGTGVSLELIVIVLIAALLAWIIIERTPFGLKSKLVGSSPNVAAWQGLQFGAFTSRPICWRAPLPAWPARSKFWVRARAWSPARRRPWASPRLSSPSSACCVCRARSWRRFSSAACKRQSCSCPSSAACRVPVYASSRDWSPC